jgi:FAD/FMN-containing dehydrogenase/Fe-S oxidoreductase
MLISTDASIFEIEPKKTIYPHDCDHLIQIVKALLLEKQDFTMRAGGTSISGQAIGKGVLVDVSKNLTKIVKFSEENREVVVEPGVIQDDLNKFLESYNLKFAPDTSTSNRAMIGGMIGNNSCGAYSAFYGTTREHVKSIEVILSDGSLVEFGELDQAELSEKVALKTLEGEIYRFVTSLVKKNRKEILDAYPDASVIRRNTGYALDELVKMYQEFTLGNKKFSLTPIFCGSEGTLGVFVRAKLNLVKVPNSKGLIVAHFYSDEAALRLVEGLLEFQPSAIEYVDKKTLDASKRNPLQNKNRAWINKDPQSILIVEFFSDKNESLEEKISSCELWLLSNEAYYVGRIGNQDYSKVWEVRKSGLGLLMGKVGPNKAVACIEDAAVPLKNLYAYYRDIKSLIRSHNIDAVYYGHASVGLIHIRPILNLSDKLDQKKMLDLSHKTSEIVAKYRGSLSGEHGDGRLRAPFLRRQFGGVVYGHLVDLKKIFDPGGIFNPGVIISDIKITNDLRKVGAPTINLKTKFNWSNDISYAYASEKCNGAGACRKSDEGVMCPSYRATRDEVFSTRGRANLLRKALYSEDPISNLKNNELKEALELCLSCKACVSECPASVDMSKLKSEYLYQIRPKINIRSWHIKYMGDLLKVASKFPKFYNHIQTWHLFKHIVGVSKELPMLSKKPLHEWWLNNQDFYDPERITVHVICDPYTQYYDAETGEYFLKFLQSCEVNINVIFSKYQIRAMISNGLLKDIENISLEVIGSLMNLPEKDIVTGIEVSEILTWRDDLASLVNVKFPKVLLFEELVLKLKKMALLPNIASFNKKIWVHVHCHQKALADNSILEQSLALIHNSEVEIIQSGCCGMAGDFGYKFPEISQKIAQQSFDRLMKGFQNKDIIISTGSSCRVQLSDFFDDNAIHLSKLFLLAIDNENNRQ